MSKKPTNADELRMNFLEEDFVYEAMSRKIRVSKMLIKGGFGDWLLVITARIDGVASVAFVGSRTIQGVAEKLHEQFITEKLVWREDKYAK